MTGATSLQTNILAWHTPVAVILVMVLGAMAMPNRIATQTLDGLKIPVLHDAQAKRLEVLAAEVRRLSDAARTNRASRAELTGSTITLTSLGRLGGIVSTPILNAPELTIVGVNRAVERPVVVAGGVTVRRMMNLSSSFDHRFIDGHDAAAFIREVRSYIERPARMFIE